MTLPALVLTALVPAAGTAGPTADEAREQARRVLGDDRFHEPSIPRPLRGALEWAGELLAPPVQWVVDRVAAIAALLPGGEPIGLGVLAALVLAAAAALAGRSLRLRAGHREHALAGERARSRGPAPAELERAAVRAERGGDLDLAVRLRFRAGLLRLGERGVIDVRESLTTGTIARRLASDEFDRLAGGFEAVAYGGRAARAEDVGAQRDGWPRLLETVSG